jgi:myo-inositol-1(or 4)-monophosphatase
VRGVRRFGTASLDLCAVGLGRFGAFFEYELAPWDFAAGALFVEEAGGRVTDHTGAVLPCRPSSVVATNGRLHDAMLDIVQTHAP